MLDFSLLKINFSFCEIPIKLTVNILWCRCTYSYILYTLGVKFYTNKKETTKHSGQLTVKKGELILYSSNSLKIKGIGHLNRMGHC
jgi:hypothetical protein